MITNIIGFAALILIFLGEAWFCWYFWTRRDQ